MDWVGGLEFAPIAHDGAAASVAERGEFVFGHIGRARDISLDGAGCLFSFVSSFPSSLTWTEFLIFFPVFCSSFMWSNVNTQ